MTSQARHIPNYPAFIVLLISILPLIFLEFSGNAGNSDFFYLYKKYFGFAILFQAILLVFVLAKTIMQYDNIPVWHRPPAVLLSLLFTMVFVALLLCWSGYFNGGLYVFEWLNK